MPDILKGTSLNAGKMRTDPMAGQEAFCSREGAATSTSRGKCGAALLRVPLACNLESSIYVLQIAHHPGS